MRSLPTAQAGSQQVSAAMPVPPTSSTAQGNSGPVTAGAKREHDDDDDEDANGDPRGSKIAKRGDDPAAAARLFDTQRNMFAMEYMRYGDVR